MRARTLLSYGLMATVAAACSNPANETARSTEDLLSELEPALLASNTAPVLSAAELSLVESPKAPRSVAAPRNAPAATVEHAAHVPSVEPTLVMAPAAAPNEAEVIATVAVAGPADHVGHTSEERPASGGIMIRGGFGGGNLGDLIRDPCITHPGMIAPESVRANGEGLGRFDKPSLGTVGAMVNDRAPRVGRAAAAYPASGRSSGRGNSAMFIR